MSNQGKKRPKRPAVVGGRPDWSGLPDLLLASVALRLPGLMDFFSFRGVCASWRSAGMAVEADAMASHPPLLFFNMNRFYHPGEKRVYTRRRPAAPTTGGLRVYTRRRPAAPTTGGFVVGSAHGYLILRRGRTPWLSNPLTGAEHHVFPRAKLPFGEATLSSPPGSPGCVLVAYNYTSVQYCRPGGQQWRVVYQPRDMLGWVYTVKSVAVARGKGFILLNGLRLLTFDFTDHPEPTLLNDTTGILRNHLFLTEFEGELFAIYTYPSNSILFLVRRFDSPSRKWVPSEDLRGRSVFLDICRNRCSSVDKFDRWRGSKDCIYFFLDHMDHVSKCMIKDAMAGPIPLPPRGEMYSFSGVWVLPSFS